jgi:hypothetical protein
MLTKTLDQVTVGETFKVNNVEYTKEQEVRVSCCKSINCHLTSDPTQRTFFPGNTVVETNG